MSAMRRPLTNTEQVYRAAYLDLCSLYANGKDDEAEKLAWQFYQDPHIPLILRIMCCNVLGEAEGGEYLRFAREAVEHATAALKLDPDNERGQLMLKESREVLKNAEEDAKEEMPGLPDLLRECKKTEAEVDKLAAEVAARKAAAHSKEDFSQHSTVAASVHPDSEVSSASSTPRKTANTMFTPLSSPQGPSWGQGGETSRKGNYDDSS